jgi:hypothetical protein
MGLVGGFERAAMKLDCRNAQRMGYAKLALRLLPRTAHELMAIFGWLTIKEAERYTQAAQRKRLARNAGQLLVRPENKTSPQYEQNPPRGS